MHPIYNVPIIPQNLRREETIIQIADALNYLSEVANDIFSRVNSRLETNNAQLSGIVNRIDAAHVKVSKLRGAKKATQVFSSSKYPAADVHRHYKSIFDNNKELPFTRTKVTFKDVQINDEPLETLQFYHVKVPTTYDVQNVSGLGEVPPDIKCVNDLLLYNTGKNPYRNYVISDPLQTSHRTRKGDTLDVSDIGAAPHSISDKTTLTKSTAESYGYSPDLGDVPSIDVPLDLPDLPGIADDLRYVDELGPGIAPSVTTTPNVPELPPLDGSVSDITNNESLSEPVLVPPPPPIVEIPSESVGLDLPVVVEPKPVESQPVRVEVVPELESVVHHVDSSVEKPPIVIDDAHASLMEAIRKAGGSKNANLRAAEPKKPAPSGDLMADLHAKLSLRRKGISGAKAQDNSSSFDSDSAMNKVSAMIPPPPVKSDQAESTNTEDEDWEE